MANKQIFQINGTHCPACKRLIERRISGISGVISVEVNFETGATELTGDKSIKKEEIQKVLEGMEYKVV